MDVVRRVSMCKYVAVDSVLTQGMLGCESCKLANLFMSRFLLMPNNVK